MTHLDHLSCVLPANAFLMGLLLAIKKSDHFQAASIIFANHHVRIGASVCLSTDSTFSF